MARGPNMYLVPRLDAPDLSSANELYRSSMRGLGGAFTGIGDIAKNIKTQDQEALQKDIILKLAGMDPDKVPEAIHIGNIGGLDITDPKVRARMNLPTAELLSQGSQSTNIFDRARATTTDTAAKQGLRDYGFGVKIDENADTLGLIDSLIGVPGQEDNVARLRAGLPYKDMGGNFALKYGTQVREGERTTEGTRGARQTNDVNEINTNVGLAVDKYTPQISKLSPDKAAAELAINSLYENELRDNPLRAQIMMGLRAKFGLEATGLGTEFPAADPREAPNTAPSNAPATAILAGGTPAIGTALGGRPNIAGGLAIASRGAVPDIGGRAAPSVGPGDPNPAANLANAVIPPEARTPGMAKYNSGGAPGTKTGDIASVVFGHGAYGSPPKPLPEMTIGEVSQWTHEVLGPNTKRAGKGQDQWGNTVGTSAVGPFQFEGRSTMTDVAAKMGIPLTTKFTLDVQDKMAEFLFNQDKGGNLKKTWTSLPHAEPGYYKNKPWSEVRDLITKGETNGAKISDFLGPNTQAGGGTDSSAANTNTPASTTLQRMTPQPALTDARIEELKQNNRTLAGRVNQAISYESPTDLETRMATAGTGAGRGDPTVSAQQLQKQFGMKDIDTALGAMQMVDTIAMDHQIKLTPGQQVVILQDARKKRNLADWSTNWLTGEGTDNNTSARRKAIEEVVQQYKGMGFERQTERNRNRNDILVKANTAVEQLLTLHTQLVAMRAKYAANPGQWSPRYLQRLEAQEQAQAALVQQYHDQLGPAIGHNFELDKPAAEAPDSTAIKGGTIVNDALKAGQPVVATNANVSLLRAQLAKAQRDIAAINLIKKPTPQDILRKTALENQLPVLNQAIFKYNNTH